MKTWAAFIRIIFSRINTSLNDRKHTIRRKSVNKRFRYCANFQGNAARKGQAGGNLALLHRIPKHRQVASGQLFKPGIGRSKALQQFLITRIGFDIQRFACQRHVV
jgi:hypothetical protein